MKTYGFVVFPSGNLTKEEIEEFRANYHLEFVCLILANGQTCTLEGPGINTIILKYPDERQTLAELVLDELDGAVCDNDVISIDITTPLGSSVRDHFTPHRHLQFVPLLGTKKS